MNAPTNAFTLGNVVIPIEGPKVAEITLNFNGNANQTVDLSQLIQNGTLSFVQCVYVDNHDNPNSLTITPQLTNLRVIVPANSQGFYSVLAPNMPVFTVSSTAGNYSVTLGFLNVPVQPDQWGAASLGSVTIAGQPLLNTNVGPTITDYSITMNGADQTPITPGQAAHYLAIQNPTGNATVNINLAGGSAATGLVLQAGGSITLDNGIANAVHVKGTNTQSLVIYAG